MITYVNHRDDSTRWPDFELRPGDVVVSTPSKAGTTWLQMISSLVLNNAPDLPAPLAETSLWLDSQHNDRDAVFAALAALPGRRVIKTHTPLDGVTLDPDVTYLAGARHPLDATVSLYHQMGNIDTAEVRRRQGLPAVPEPARPPLVEWLRTWIDDEPNPFTAPISLGSVLHHHRDAWARREDPNVLLVHYADLSSDLTGQMRRIASALDVQISPAVLPRLVEAAGFASMRAHADQLAPRSQSLPLKDRTAFFRTGRSGAARDVLTDDDLARYHASARTQTTPDLFDWLHRP